MHRLLRLKSAKKIGAMLVKKILKLFYIPLLQQFTSIVLILESIPCWFIGDSITHRPTTTATPPDGSSSDCKQAIDIGLNTLISFLMNFAMFLQVIVMIGERNGVPWINRIYGLKNAFVK